MKVEEIEIGKIVPYWNNPRKNENAIEKVANSIREFGFQQPIVVDSNMVIVVGHTRLEAAKKLGMKSVPVIIADNLDEKRAKAYRLADNKTNEFSEWDFNMLEKELSEIDLDMSQFGFTDLEIDESQFGEDFGLPDGEGHTRTITLSLSERQWEICQNVQQFVLDEGMDIHDFGNHNENSNALFEAIYQ